MPVMVLPGRLMTMRRRLESERQPNQGHFTASTVVEGHTLVAGGCRGAHWEVQGVVRGSLFPCTVPWHVVS